MRSEIGCRHFWSLNADESNEITAVPAVIKTIDIAGGHITADALHCQTDLVEQVDDAEATYTISVKANQKTLYHDIAATFTKLRQQSSAATYVRGHWQIENGLHWRLDVILNEDNAHIRVNHGPENMAVLRHIALNLLLSESTMKAGVQSKRLRAACSNVYLKKVLCPSKTS